MEIFFGNKTLNLPITDEIVRFSSDYEIRTYSSACFYLDQNDKWQSNGLLASFCTI